jgi:hypothetical protein
MTDGKKGNALVDGKYSENASAGQTRDLSVGETYATGLIVISAVLAVTVGLYAIGLRLTPRTERGRPGQASLDGPRRF